MKPKLNTVSAFSGALLSDTPVSGQVTVANADAFEAANLSTPLTRFISALPADNIQAVLDMLFPSIPGGMIVQYRKLDDLLFLTETDDEDIRAEGGDFKRVEIRGTAALDTLKQKGLTYRQDVLTIPRGIDGQPLPGWENQRAAWLQQRLIRAEILRGLAALRTAGGAATAKTWNASSNPDKDLRALVKASRTGSGIRPTHVIFGDTAWQTRQDAYEDSTRANQNMTAHANYDEAALARYLKVEKVAVVEALYQAAKDGAKSEILANEVIAYAAPSGQSMEDPSSIKRITAPASLLDGGGSSAFAVYIKRSSIYVDITVAHMSTFLVPQTSGVKRYTTSGS